MKTKSIFAILALLAALFSCQSEALEGTQGSNEAKTEFRIRAYIDSPEDSRAAIEYGYGYNKDDEDKEIFTWLNSCSAYDRDYITLFNISKFSEFHQSLNAPMMFLDKIIGKQAEFVYDPDSDKESTEIEKFKELMEPGDTILAVVCEAHAANLADCSPEYSNVISYHAGSSLYDQKIVENPTTLTAMKHVHMMMRLYDVVKVDEKGNIPDLHFKHFSSIFRVTLQNKTGKSLFHKISEIVFTASSKDRSTFIYGFNYFSVVPNETDGVHLEENFKETPKRHPLNPTPVDTTMVLSHKTTHQINKLGGDSLKNGETYEFYAVVTPRIGGPEFTPETIEKLTIDIFNDGAESAYYNDNDAITTKPDRYTITIENFNTAIEPGKRYWFNLTATDEKEDVLVDIYDKNDDNKVIGTEQRVQYRLMFTSEWNATHNSGGNTSTEQ